MAGLMYFLPGASIAKVRRGDDLVHAELGSADLASILADVRGSGETSFFDFAGSNANIGRTSGAVCGMKIGASKLCCSAATCLGPSGVPAFGATWSCQRRMPRDTRGNSCMSRRQSAECSLSPASSLTLLSLTRLRITIYCSGIKTIFTY